ncbi:MAG TPA: ATP-binding protein [Myxococcota bacterium]|nr:ATP-binding protein [Myxococcota bacterium]
MDGVTLLETRHPNPDAARQFQSLLGVDEHKHVLLEQLRLLLDPTRLDDWLSKHHPRGLPLVDRAGGTSPLIILAGEVGCGKTALATSIGTPLAEHLDRRLVTLETPANIRGSGHVGELSLRLSAAFDQARQRIGNSRGGMLIIDEGDDLAASREQEQAHHEDRAGLNVLVKQLDQVARARLPMAVVLITNRLDALDPAIRRRASLTLTFGRPNAAQRAQLFASLLAGVPHGPADPETLAALSEHPVGYAWSDLVHRVGRRALLAALAGDRPLSVGDLREAIAQTEPSPRLGSRGAR